MISARPALLSAPSSVVPSVVMMSLPIWSASAGCSAARITWVWIGRQRDIAAAIIPDDLRLDVFAGAVGRGVHVRAEADHRHVLVGVGRDRRVDIAVFVEMGVGKADLLQLAREQAAKILFAFRWKGRSAKPGPTGCR